MSGELRMLDSIYPANLPGGADAYLAYDDGNWPTAAAVKAKFPGARVVVLSVFAGDVAQGYDREPGDLDVTQLAAAVARSLHAGVWWPVVYASASNMGACISALAAAGIMRPEVRLLSAHYGAGRHICGPHSCGQTTVDMDGTQWRDDAPGANGTLVDESLLVPGFFGAAPAPAPVPVPAKIGDIMFGIIPPAATISAPVPAGSKGIRLFCDLTTLKNAVPVRVAAYSASKGYSQIVTVHLDDSKPHDTTFTAPDVTAVSLSQAVAGSELLPGFLII